MTKLELVKRINKIAPEFFRPKTMRFFGQTLKDFKVTKVSDYRYKLQAPVRQGQCPDTVVYYNKFTNRLEWEQI
jgi:NADPH-dependent ferric siderophore reductase